MDAIKLQKVDEVVNVENPENVQCWKIEILDAKKYTEYLFRSLNC